MKLKGKNVKNLKPVKKAQMEKTLKKMEETRNKDSVNLRAHINKKVEFLVIEKEKAITCITNLKNKIIEFEEMSLKIDGAVVALQEVLANDTNV